MYWNKKHTMKKALLIEFLDEIRVLLSDARMDIEPSLRDEIKPVFEKLDKAGNRIYNLIVELKK